MTSEAEKKLLTYAMLGAAFTEMFEKPAKKVKRTCGNCRLCIEHNQSNRCTRNGKKVSLNESCKRWEEKRDD